MEILTLVKLDSGDYINTKYVTKIWASSGLVYDKGQIVVNIKGEAATSITPSDRDRIVEAMQGVPLHITSDTVFDDKTVPADAIDMPIVAFIDKDIGTEQSYLKRMQRRNHIE